MLVDTHAHLDMADFAGDLAEVLGRARDAGVGRILTVGIDLASSRRALALAEEHEDVWAAVGIHPSDARQWREGDESTLEELLAHPKVVAVGETGLDFYRDRAPRDLQRRLFRLHLDLARSRDLPVVIHARQALETVLEVLLEAGPGTRGVMHCYSGTMEEARPFLDLGLRLSLGGPLTYPNAAAARHLVSSLPAEVFLLETDCPYLPPQSSRGRRNEPAFLGEAAEAMAGLKGLSRDDIARITTANARDLFGLGLEESGGVIAYRIRRSLYLNVTNRCSNACTFCARRRDYSVKGHDLRLAREPSAEDILAAVAGQADFDEVVFCGFGEPLLRLELVRDVAGRLKAAGRRVRVNTNGLASLIHGRSVPEELRGAVDAYSVSLNAAEADAYERLCRPQPGPGSFEAVKTFIRDAVRAGAEVTATAVAVPGLDLEAVRRLAASLGAGFRARPYDEVG